MQPLKVMTVVGTRPEIIRLSEVIRECDRCFRHVLVHTGQNWDYTLNQVFFEELQLRPPDYYLGAAEESLGATIGNIISKSYEVLQRERPDALVILGDTNSCLCAIPAKRLKIPVFHLEAGNRCFDENVPEEINRRIVDHISDVNLAYTEHSRRYLLSEGIRKDFVFVIGSPMAEVLHKNRDRIQSSTILNELGLRPGEYFLVSAHREENVDDLSHLRSLVESLSAVAEEYGFPIIYSTHPRSWKRIDESGLPLHPLVKRMRPFGFLGYNKLQLNAYCVLSDSGTLSEESAILGFPAVLIRTSTERPEVLDKGAIVIGGIHRESILQAIELSRRLWEAEGRPPLPADYHDTNVSSKVVRIVQSYTPIVNRVVWGKSNWIGES